YVEQRAANFTKTEENILLDLVRKYVLIVEHKKADAVSAKQKADCWQQITESGPPLPADDSQDKVLMDILGTQLTGFQSQYDDDKIRYSL
ncbi:uncharacterized protein LOC112128059, partial [Cimex lectularius]|uniref:Regulatory protein zeste n=1 Tax=Cimex lectularius TaxID=79782 RepID=A0A8I6TMW5_CIMLE